MAQLTHGTWVLVADGEKALFLRNDLDEITPGLSVVREEHQDNPLNAAQGSDRPGRMPDPGPGQRSGLEAADWHRLAKEHFADELADILYRYAHKGAFARIVLVAPARVLGELRRKLHKEVSARVIAELPRDLTNHPLDKVETMLKAELDPSARGAGRKVL